LVIWYILPRFGKYYRDKSGNPGSRPRSKNATGRPLLGDAAERKIFSNFFISWEENFFRRMMDWKRMRSEKVTEACWPVLPDAIFSYQNYHFGYILEGLGMENVAIFFHI
jgi:hypothetical protein